MAGIDQILHDVEDLLDVLRGAGLDGRLAAVQTGGILQVLGLEPLCHFLHGSALFPALGDQLIVDVGDVGDIEDFVAPVLEVAAQGVKDDQRAGVADVDIVIDGRAADIDAVLTGHLRNKLFFLTGQRVKDLHDFLLLLCDSQKPQKSRPSNRTFCTGIEGGF